jgi:hypothetical protein
MALLLVLLVQGASCGPEGTAAMERARRLAFELDLGSSRAAYAESARLGCDDAATIVIYLDALQVARDAYRAGGSEAALAPVRAAVATLDARTAAGSATADIARTLLQAASAAAQSERDDMNTFLTHAVHLDAVQRAIVGRSTLPMTALELAGDLWLQVHRFDEARAAYKGAAEVVGSTPRIALGLARVASRLNDVSGACAAYRSQLQLLTLPSRKETRPDPPEIEEARRYVTEHACR